MIVQHSNCKDAYSELARDLHKKLPMRPNKFTGMLEEVDKNIMFGFSKAVRMAEIFDRFLTNGAEVLAFPLGNIMNLSLKISTFPEDCKLAELKPILEKTCND